jgi:dihydrofolate synthase/folylpolyglutamate synthase
MFHRIGAAAYKADLKNTLAICALLHHPENKFQSIHVAGTNGKGSTSHMLAAILQAAGYKTGLYTSPHLKDFRERIRINGNMIPENEVTGFVEKHRVAFEEIKPSFFEWTVGLAFDYFAKEKVEIAVIETGLGGRLDSTNVITPLISVITNIGLDHMNLLGDTLEKITKEKAGIIKKNIPVVIGERQPEIENIFLKKAKEMNAGIFFADEQYRCEPVAINEQFFLTLNIYKNNRLLFRNLALDLTGSYQQKNVLTVLQTIFHLKKNKMPLPDEHIFGALKNVKGLTGLMGRWQILSEEPLTICDVGHNKEGMKYVVEQIRQTPYNHLHMVLGFVNDKDISGMLELLPQYATYYFCKADIPRAMNTDELKRIAENFSLKGNSYKSVREALQHARSRAKEKDLIFVGGSTFVVAEVI